MLMEASALLETVYTGLDQLERNGLRLKFNLASGSS